MLNLIAAIWSLMLMEMVFIDLSSHVNGVVGILQDPAAGAAAEQDVDALAVLDLQADVVPLGGPITLEHIHDQVVHIQRHNLPALVQFPLDLLADIGAGELLTIDGNAA